jgi:hypothetical protein
VEEDRRPGEIPAVSVFWAEDPRDFPCAEAVYGNRKAQRKYEAKARFSESFHQGIPPMRRLLALSILFLCSVALAQGKYRPGQYPVNQNPANYTIKVHISATHFRSCMGPPLNDPCTDGLFVDATLDGKKFEIFGGVDKHQTALIVPGDYLAMLPKKPRSGGRPVLGQGYYVLLPDRSAWPCGITGISQ